MAANGDSNHGSGQGQSPFHPLMVTDNFDDIMHLLHVPGDGGLYSPPPLQNLTNGSYGGNPLDWTAMPGNGYSSVDGSAPPAVGSTIAGPSTSSAHHGGLDCIGCQILREVVHTNGFETAKLCIHGAAGLFYHATVEVYQVNPEGLVAMEPKHRSFVDFMGRDYAWVKHYLMDYAQQRASHGETIVHDSTSDFHDVLCTSMAGSTGHADGSREVEAPVEAKNGVDEQHVLLNAVDSVQSMAEFENIMPVVSGPSEPSNNAANVQEQQDVVGHPVRSRLAIQRERASKLELSDISRYFHLTMVDACKELRLCATVLKGIRRKFGIKRWPYRAIKKIDDEIAKLRENGNGSATADRIQKLSDSRRKIVNNGP
ncbi:hypothetical protein QOZ80_5BG0433290 [Eleusine coracana subsp. coracana]|nr:hypothetical protein QOZ80_5BG0433290 [Eleusine coracana subsp. coracana]